jgi:hypothetical protein
VVTRKQALGGIKAADFIRQCYRIPLARGHINWAAIGARGDAAGDPAPTQEQDVQMNKDKQMAISSDLCGPASEHSRENDRDGGRMVRLGYDSDVGNSAEPD